MGREDWMNSILFLNALVLKEGLRDHGDLRIDLPLDGAAPLSLISLSHCHLLAQKRPGSSGNEVALSGQWICRIHF